QFMLQAPKIFELGILYFVLLAILVLYHEWKGLIIPVVLQVLIIAFVQLNPDSLPLATGTLSVRLFIITYLFIIGFFVICAVLAQTLKEAMLTKASANNDLEAQRQTIEVNASFADQISQGNLKAEYPSKQ